MREAEKHEPGAYLEEQSRLARFLKQQFATSIRFGDEKDEPGLGREPALIDDVDWAFVVATRILM